MVHGQVLIVGTNPEENDFDLLSRKQVEIVKTQVRLYYSDFPKQVSIYKPNGGTFFSRLSAVVIDGELAD